MPRAAKHPDGHPSDRLKNRNMQQINVCAKGGYHQSNLAFNCSITMNTIVTLGTTRPKFGQKPLYKEKGPSRTTDLVKQSIMPAYSVPLPVASIG
mmetsp:Transcript_91343/g.142600  ORF Transcript_91343/g.142600 Transcript_91343/m.142600 type:complete len:95 (-) Transcript_91343:624-908(-)